MLSLANYVRNLREQGMGNPSQRPIHRVMVFCFSVLFFVVSILAAPANTPPTESTSKVKRVLLYNQIGGWRAIEGIANVKQYMASLALSKGFALDTLSNDTGITLEFLKQYQVIVWNNNSNAAVSVPTRAARDAIVEYVSQGGGWFLVGLAGDHANSWPALTDMLGATFRVWSGGVAKMMADSSAMAHSELKYVVKDLPQEIRLNETWMTFNQTVRPLANVTVLYTAHNISATVLQPRQDGSSDHPYVWVRTIQSGRMLYCSAGWSSAQPSPIAQADSAVAKIYWSSMRWLAGDFQNGCTDPNSLNFNPEARVDDGSCQGLGVRVDRHRSVRQPRLHKEIKASHDVRGRIRLRPEAHPRN
jgi:uncharacterized protein